VSGPLKCRVPVQGGEVAIVECGKDAAVGLVIASVDISKRDILELVPLCMDHGPETTSEMLASANIEDWTIVTLAYGGSGGDLR
jgi:hypothetical protein